MKSFVLTLDSIQLSKAAGYIHFKDEHHGIYKLRQAIQATCIPEDGQPSLHVPNIVHMTFVRFIKTLDDLKNKTLGIEVKIRKCQMNWKKEKWGIEVKKSEKYVELKWKVGSVKLQCKSENKVRNWSEKSEKNVWNWSEMKELIWSKWKKWEVSGIEPKKGGMGNWKGKKGEKCRNRK